MLFMPGQTGGGVFEKGVSFLNPYSVKSVDVKGFLKLSFLTKKNYIV